MPTAPGPQTPTNQGLLPFSGSMQSPGDPQV